MTRRHPPEVPERVLREEEGRAMTRNEYLAWGVLAQWRKHRGGWDAPFLVGRYWTHATAPPSLAGHVRAAWDSRKAATAVARASRANSGIRARAVRIRVRIDVVRR